MRLLLSATLGLASVHLHLIVQAEFLESSDQCAVGQYWCQDRCGSNTDGETCCQTPDGQHNMCGANGTCCQFGCCRFGGICNEMGACEFVVTITAPGGSVATTTTTESAGGPKTLISTGTLTETNRQSVTSPNGSPASTPTVTNTQVGNPTTSATTTQNQVPTVTSIATTYTGTDGESITSSAGVVYFGTESITLPIVTVTSLYTILGKTFTLQPAYTSSTGSASLPFSGTVTVIGTQTITLSSASALSTLTTLGVTITLTPVNTRSVTVIGTNTVTLPRVTETTILTTLGSTITLDPASATETNTDMTSPTSTTTVIPPPLTSTLDNGRTLVSSSNIVIIDTDTYTVPTGIITPVTFTGNEVTLTFLPSSGSLTTTSFIDSTTTSTGVAVGIISSADRPSSDSTTDTESPTTTTTTTLPIYTTWPPGAILIPTDKSTETPEPTDDGTLIPCKLWFFWICIDWDITITSWMFKLPPGIYPPGPPPPVQWPSGVTMFGKLPDWPPITIGTDRILTYPTQPTSESCTKPTPPASICAVTTSFGVSVSEGITIMTTTDTVTGACTTDNGCQATGSTDQVTTTEACSTTTATDSWVTCTASSPEACTTTRTSIVSGCDVTATTRTCSQPTETGVGARADDESCGQPSALYAVYPKEISDTATNDIIAAKLATFVNDPSEIYTSMSKSLGGVLFWRLMLTRAQGDELMALGTVGGITYEYDGNGDEEWFDPTTSLAYQDWSDNTDARGTTDEQLVFISQENGIPLDQYSHRYFFDDSAGEDIPVFIVDSGASLAHKVSLAHYRGKRQCIYYLQEFDLIRDKVQWIHVGKDFNQVNGVNGENDCQVDRRPNIPDNQKNKNEKAHGTAMLSAVAGVGTGVSKMIKPILVRLPQLSPIGGGWYPTDFLDGLEAVSKYYSDDSSTTRAILLLATYYPRESLEDSKGWEFGFDTYKEQLHKLIKDIIAKGILPVTGSGNDQARGGVRGWPPIDGVPALLGIPGQDSTIDELLMVGALDPKTGMIWQRTSMDTRGAPHVYAPGANVRVADGNSVTWPDMMYKTSYGTSEGLAAYFLKLYQLGELPGLLDPSPQGLKQYIVDVSLKKPVTDIPYGDNVIWPTVGSIWNEIEAAWTAPACRWQPNPLIQRQEGAVCELPVNDATGSVAGSGEATATQATTIGNIPVCPFGVACDPSTFMTSTIPATSGASVAETLTNAVSTLASTMTTPDTPVTTTQVHTTPSPTEGVSIYFELGVSVVGDYLQLYNYYWNLFAQMLDGSTLDPCKASDVGYTPADDSISYTSVPWPISFDSTKSISGRNGCHYIAGTDGPGQFACEGVTTFDCIAHDQKDQIIDCGTDNNGLDRTYVPKVKCLFPV